MIPKKNLIEKAEKEGATERLGKLISVTNLLTSQANMFIEEAYDLMAQYDLTIGGLKDKHSKFTRAADAFFKQIATMVPTQKETLNVFEDMDAVDKWIREFSGLDKTWKPRKEAIDE